MVNNHNYLLMGVCVCVYADVCWTTSQTLGTECCQFHYLFHMDFLGGTSFSSRHLLDTQLHTALTSLKGMLHSCEIPCMVVCIVSDRCQMCLLWNFQIPSSILGRGDGVHCSAPGCLGTCFGNHEFKLFIANMNHSPWILTLKSQKSLATVEVNGKHCKPTVKPHILFFHLSSFSLSQPVYCEYFSGFTV